ncbi:hypothetical protein [Bradyrhizobium phage BDU-MI-1]|nr:hypothetical protein [Bradyrhizobium phage BDU-MI-1]
MLKAIVTDLNAIDEAHRGFYVAKDGKFFLNVTPVDGFQLDNTTGLKTALGAERNNVSVLQAQLKPFEGLDVAAARTAMERIGAFGDITPEAAKTAIETAARLQALDPEKQADQIANTKLETFKSQVTAQFNLKETEYGVKIKGLEDTNASLVGQLKDLMGQSQIKSEVAKSNPLDDARDAVELLVGQYVRTSMKDGKVVVDVIDANGNPRIKDAAGTPFTVADLVAEIREKSASLFKPDEKRGLGTNPGSNGTTVPAGTVNPYAKETFNLTQQMVLEKTKPELAKQLEAAAAAAK